MFFPIKMPMIVISIENASVHKRADIAEQIEAGILNYRREYLPKYIADSSLIELVWNSAKK